jgi:hypothetical protein
VKEKDKIAQLRKFTPLERVIKRSSERFQLFFQIV